MKPTMLKLLGGLGCIFLISSTPFKKPDPAAGKPFTAYWYAVSGNELIQVGKAAIPESALTRDANGKLSAIDNNVVESKIQFRNEKVYNNKNINAHFIILSDGENQDAAGSVTQGLLRDKSRNNLFYTQLECAVITAYKYCWNYYRISDCPGHWEFYCNWGGYSDLALVVGGIGQSWYIRNTSTTQ